jgi:uncharacterized protein (TIGR00730 family)
MTRRLSICVYCGSREGAQSRYGDAAQRVGRLIGERGWRLVYGGGKVGLMGIVADAVLAAGAEVVGVIPETLMRREVGHQGLTELHVVQTMHQRKQMMAERADAFIALPGGIGTLEEFFEVWTWAQLGYHDNPIGLLNVAGYYDPLLGFMQRTADEGFLSATQLAAIDVDDDEERLLDTLARKIARGSGKDDYSRV